MGNYRFRFSDMIPNAWFYKLKDMSKTRKRYKNPSSSSKSQKSHNSNPTYSYYFNTEPLKAKAAGRLYNSPVHLEASGGRFLDSPRKSLRRRDRRRTIYKPSPKVISSVSSGFNGHDMLNPVPTNYCVTDHSPDYSLSPFESSPDHGSIQSDSEEDDCKLSSSTTDIVIDMKNELSHTRKLDIVGGFDAISELELRPILTKLPKLDQKTKEVSMLNMRRSSYKYKETKPRGPRQALSVKIVKEELIRSRKEPKTNAVARKPFANSPGIKLRANSPRIASKKIRAYAQKSISLKSRNGSIAESFAIVKSSIDPLRDFRESMVEMIMENNIRESKGLEDLLACYLSLNSNQYHDLIIKAFEQIWIDLTNLRL